MSFILFANLFNTIDEYKKNEVVIIKGRVVKRIDKYQVNITNRYWNFSRLLVKYEVYYIKIKKY